VSLQRRLQADYVVEEVPSRHQERALVMAGRWGGGEVRPTRLFVWLGERGAGREWIVPLGRQPRLLRFARRRRHLRLAGLRVSYLGNPAVTCALFAYELVRSRLALRAAA